MESLRETTLISVHGDGTCLFRCIALFCNPNLRESPRSEGLPIDTNKKNLETELAVNLRQIVCKVLKKNARGLRKIARTLPYLVLEKSQGEFYEDIEDRVQNMKNYTEHAGTLEIIALSYLLERQIRVYRLKSNYKNRFSVMECIGTFPPNYYCENKPRVYLLHRGDSFNEGSYEPGHFDLLVPRNDRPPSTESLRYFESFDGSDLTFLNLKKKDTLTLIDLICQMHEIKPEKLSQTVLAQRPKTESKSKTAEIHSLNSETKVKSDIKCKHESSRGKVSSKISTLSSGVYGDQQPGRKLKVGSKILEPLLSDLQPEMVRTVSTGGGCEKPNPPKSKNKGKGDSNSKLNSDDSKGSSKESSKGSKASSRASSKGSGDRVSKKPRKKKPVKIFKVTECSPHDAICPSTCCYKMGRDLPLGECKADCTCLEVPNVGHGPCKPMEDFVKVKKEEECKCIAEGDAREEDIFPPLTFLEALAPCSDPPYCAPVSGFIKGLRESNSDRIRMEVQEEEKQRTEKINDKNREIQKENSRSLNKCMLDIEMAACGAKNSSNQTPYVKYLVEKKYADVKINCCKAAIADMQNQIRINKRRIRSLRKQRGIMEIQIEKDTEVYLKEKRFARLYITCLFEGSSCQLKELQQLKDEKKKLQAKQNDWKVIYKEMKSWLTQSVTTLKKITLLDEFPCIFDSMKEAILALEEGKKEKSLCPFGAAYNVNAECPDDLRDLVARLEDAGRKLFTYINALKKIICDPDAIVKGVPEATGDLKLSLRTPIISLDNFMRSACSTAHITCKDVDDFNEKFNIMEHLTVGQILRNSNFLKCLTTMQQSAFEDYCKPC